MTEVSLVVGPEDAVTREIVRVLGDRGSAVGLVTAAAEADAGADAATTVLTELDDPESLTSAIESVRSRIGAFSTVVTITQPASPGRIPELELADWARAIDSSVTRTYLVARQTLDDLLCTTGSFVAVTSTAAVRGVGGHGAHAAAAHGVVGLVKSMAIDHGRDGVRCNVVSAGYVEAEGRGESFGIREVPDSRVPSRRLATAREVAHLVGHMTSSRASYATATVAVLDGALSAGLLKGT